MRGKMPLQAFIDTVTRPWVYASLLITFALLFVWMEVPALPYSAADFGAHTNGVPSLDMRIGYSPDQAYETMGSYGADGRSYYIWKLLINDTIFPIGYSLFFAGTLALLLKGLTGPKSRLRYLALVPLVGGILDLLENGGILTMLLAYPAEIEAIAMATGLITAVKLAVNVTAMLLIVACLPIAAYSVLRKAGRTNPKNNPP